MVDFSKMLSPEARARVARNLSEAARLYRLPDRFLAAALLKLSRAALDATPRIQPGTPTYDSALFWDIVPEVARRLGVTEFRANERRDPVVVKMANGVLRLRAGYCLANVFAHDYDSLLLHEPANGNPLCFALDRLAPPRDIHSDPIANRIVGPARARGVDFDGTWTPALLDYPGASRRAAAPPDGNPASVTPLRRP